MTDKITKLKVMHIILNLDIGGGQEVVRTLVKYLASDECEPIVCTFKDGPLRSDIEQLGIKVEVLPARQYSVVALPWFIKDMVRIYRRLTGLVRQYDINIIQTHLLSSLDFLVLFLLFTTRLQSLFWTFHNTNFELTAAKLPRYVWLLGIKKWAYRFLYRLTAGWVSGFIAVSDDVKKAMVRVIGPIDKYITVISNGVDVARYEQAVDKIQVKNGLGLAANSRLITVVATLKEQKGHAYLVEAATTIVPRHPNIHMLFIGDGILREKLGAQVDHLNLHDNIHFLGNRHDIPVLLAASDYFVLPSLWEGLPMALLEAMAAGLPIVATQVSGSSQVMIPGQTGLLVPPGDSQQLAEAIDYLLNHPAQAQAMGLAARQQVKEKYSARKQAEEHLALYRLRLQEG